MSNEIEYQYLTTQLRSTEVLINSTNQDISDLLTIVSRKRKLLSELTTYNKELSLRLNAIGDNDKQLIKYTP